jgi:hypothetical protein
MEEKASREDWEYTKYMAGHGVDDVFMGHYRFVI